MLYVHVFTCVHVYTYICISVYLCIYVYINTHLHSCIYMYIYMYMRVPIHILKQSFAIMASPFKEVCNIPRLARTSWTQLHWLLTCSSRTARGAALCLSEFLSHQTDASMI